MVGVEVVVEAREAPGGMRGRCQQALSSHQPPTEYSPRPSAGSLRSHSPVFFNPGSLTSRGQGGGKGKGQR